MRYIVIASLLFVVSCSKQGDKPEVKNNEKRTINSQIGNGAFEKYFSGEGLKNQGSYTNEYSSGGYQPNNQQISAWQQEESKNFAQELESLKSQISVPQMQIYTKQQPISYQGPGLDFGNYKGQISVPQIQNSHPKPGNFDDYKSQGSVPQIQSSYPKQQTANFGVNFENYKGQISVPQIQNSHPKPSNLGVNFDDYKSQGSVPQIQSSYPKQQTANFGVNFENYKGQISIPQIQNSHPKPANLGGNYENYKSQISVPQIQNAYPKQQPANFGINFENYKSQINVPQIQNPYPKQQSANFGVNFENYKGQISAPQVQESYPKQQTTWDFGSQIQNSYAKQPATSYQQAATTIPQNYQHGSPAGLDIETYKSQFQNSYPKQQLSYHQTPGAESYVNQKPELSFANYQLPSQVKFGGQQGHSFEAPRREIKGIKFEGGFRPLKSKYEEEEQTSEGTPVHQVAQSYSLGAGHSVSAAPSTQKVPYEVTVPQHYQVPAPAVSNYENPEGEDAPSSITLQPIKSADYDKYVNSFTAKQVELNNLEQNSAGFQYNFGDRLPAQNEIQTKY